MNDLELKTYSLKIFFNDVLVCFADGLKLAHIDILLSNFSFCNCDIVISEEDNK